MSCLLRQLLVLVVLLLMVPLSSCNLENMPRDNLILVHTTLGLIEGIAMKSFSGQTIYAFRGVPYAQPPVGELRFQAPRPIQAWGNKPLMADSDSLICPQAGDTLSMSEDCLKLNVFTKNLTANLPVIVYIHGGANVLGSGHSLYEAGPQYLLEHDVVLVTFNYRLGALGFLGGSNNAYLDQLMALEWVQSHINRFGGNPDKVTLLGLSSGAMAVSLHLASPLSTGLFHRAILMSGSATNHFSIQNQFWSRLLARQVSCPLYDSFDMTECLRNVTWQRIVEVCASWEHYKFVNIKWNYEIDGSFMPKHPTVLIGKGIFNKVPLLVSFTINELDFTTLGHLGNDLLLHDIITNFDEYAPELFLFDYDKRKSRRIKDFYLGKHTDELNSSNIERFGQIFSDSIIGHGVYRLVQLARYHTKVYYTRMDYIGQRSLSAPLTQDNKPNGVGHADDWQYVMPGLWYGTQMSENSTDVFMMKRMTAWFARFAKTGKPMPNAYQDWPSCNATQMHLLYNNKVTKLGSPAFVDHYAVWDELFPMPRAESAAQSQHQLVVIVFGVGLFGSFFFVY